MPVRCRCGTTGPSHQTITQSPPPLVSPALVMALCAYRTVMLLLTLGHRHRSRHPRLFSPRAPSGLLLPGCIPLGSARSDSGSACIGWVPLLPTQDGRAVHITNGRHQMRIHTRDKKGGGGIIGTHRGINGACTLMTTLHDRIHPIVFCPPACHVGFLTGFHGMRCGCQLIGRPRLRHGDGSSRINDA